MAWFFIWEDESYDGNFLWFPYQFLINAWVRLNCGLNLRFTHRIRNRYGIFFFWENGSALVREDVLVALALCFSFEWKHMEYIHSKQLQSILHPIKQLPMQIRFVLWPCFGVGYYIVQHQYIYMYIRILFYFSVKFCLYCFFSWYFHFHVWFFSIVYLCFLLFFRFVILFFFSFGMFFIRLWGFMHTRIL